MRENMFKKILLLIAFVMLNACVTFGKKEKEKEEDIALSPPPSLAPSLAPSLSLAPSQSSQNDNAVLELYFDEKTQSLALQQAKDVDKETVVYIEEKSLLNSNNARVENNDDVIIYQKDDLEVIEEIVLPEEKTVFSEEKVAPSEEKVVFSEEKVAPSEEKVAPSEEKVALSEEESENKIELLSDNSAAIFNLNEDTSGTGIDIVFNKKDKNELKKEASENKLGTGIDVVFKKAEVIKEKAETQQRLTTLPMDINSINNRKNPIVKEQLRQQYQQEEEKRQDGLKEDVLIQKIGKNAFEQFSQEINKDIIQLEQIKNNYQNVDKNTSYLKNKTDTQNSLNLLEKSFYTNNNEAKVTNISLENVKKTVTKIKNKKGRTKKSFVNELLQLENSNTKKQEQTTTQKNNYDNLLVLNLSSLKKDLDKKVTELEVNTKMWQSIDVKSNKLVKDKIKQNQVLREKLAKFKKRLNSSNADNSLSKAELYEIIKQLNQLDKLNLSYTPQTKTPKKANQKEINKLLKELKKTQD
jgi:hypothetical protein